jgi:hypothetical protein
LASGLAQQEVDMTRKEFLTAATAMGVAVGTLAAPVTAQAAAELPFGEARLRHFRAVRLPGEAPLYVTPEIHALLESTGPRSDLARHFMRFLKGLGG